MRAMMLATTVLAMCAGCALNLGPGRLAVTYPFSNPTQAMDSQATQQKTGKAGAGQTATAADVKAADQAQSPAGDQTIVVGRDATWDKLTEGAYATEQGATQAAGQDAAQTGDRNANRKKNSSTALGTGSGGPVNDNSADTID